MGSNFSSGFIGALCGATAVSALVPRRQDPYVYVVDRTRGSVYPPLMLFMDRGDETSSTSCEETAN